MIQRPLSSSNQLLWIHNKDFPHTRSQVKSAGMHWQGLSIFWPISSQCACLPRTLAFSLHMGEHSLNPFASIPHLMTTWQNGLVLVFDCWPRKWMAGCNAAGLKLWPQIVSRNIATHLHRDQVFAVAWKGVINLWAGSDWLLVLQISFQPLKPGQVYSRLGK